MGPEVGARVEGERQREKERERESDIRFSPLLNTARLLILGSSPAIVISPLVSNEAIIAAHLEPRAKSAASAGPISRETTGRRQ